MKLLHFIPSLEYGGAARQLLLLAMGLPRERFTLRVCTLGRATPWVETLRAAGVETDVLDRTRTFDLAPWFRLRQLLREYWPDVVHAWAFPWLWPGRLLQRWAGASRWIFSTFLPASQRMPRLGTVDRMLRFAPFEVVVRGPSEAERCRRLGIPDERITPIAPAVARSSLAARAPALRAAWGVPEDACLLAGVGPLEPAKSFIDAVWAMDMLRFIRPDVHMVIIGQGSDEEAIDRFARSIRVADHVHRIGPQAEATSILRQAEFVVAPSRGTGGVNAVLEAMAEGRPVIVARQPDLMEVVREGETGLCFNAGDQVMLARQMRILVDDPARRLQMGEAGRRHVEKHFSVAAMVKRYAALYLSDGVASRV